MSARIPHYLGEGFMDADGFRHWVNEARPGERIEYWRSESGFHGTEAYRVAAAAREASERGLVNLCQRPSDPRPGLKIRTFHYLAERR